MECECGLTGPCKQENCKAPILTASRSDAPDLEKLFHEIRRASTAPGDLYDRAAHAFFQHIYPHKMTDKTAGAVFMAGFDAGMVRSEARMAACRDRIKQLEQALEAAANTIIKRGLAGAQEQQT